MSTSADSCPNPELHGNPFRYCPSCSWIEPAPAPRYEIVGATDRSLPTIIDNSSKQSVLALDDRLVDGRRHVTPVFATEEIAAKVLRALNTP